MTNGQDRRLRDIEIMMRQSLQNQRTIMETLAMTLDSRHKRELSELGKRLGETDHVLKLTL